MIRIIIDADENDLLQIAKYRPRFKPSSKDLTKKEVGAELVEDILTEMSEHAWLKEDKQEVKKRNVVVTVGM